MALRPPPSEHLDPKARALWRWSGLLGTLPLLGLALVGSAALWWFQLRWWLVALPVMVVLLIGAVSAFVLPGLIWRSWRYEVGQEEVDLQHGVITMTRTLIPMARIQHVDTRRGPLQRHFGLASVILHTAAGASEIPALADPIAEDVRDRIAALANTREEL
ncbi:MAG TPA: PH domain-containing protein [Thermomicrobiales bacterium]|nr:PH domain-containing protein [Thermomicrobiales bacterium]